MSAGTTYQTAGEGRPRRGDPNRRSPRIDPREVAQAHRLVEAISRTFDSKVVGQEALRTALLVGLIGGGHVLLESVPGLAKTLAASTLASTVDASFSRVQCTPDLLPSDIIGTQVFNPGSGTFTTELGPVHANVVLLDEINRSSAKTQAAMLEAMQEKQATIGAKTYPMPDPFLVLATQNPIDEEGTYVLPQAQMDRFLLKVIVDYPSPADEVEMLRRLKSGVLASRTVPPVVRQAGCVVAPGSVEEGVRGRGAAALHRPDRPRDPSWRRLPSPGAGPLPRVWCQSAGHDRVRRGSLRPRAHTRT